SPTIRELAALIRTISDVSGIETIDPAARQESYVLSHAQQRLWFLHQLGAATAYNMPVALIIEGDIDGAALSQAFETLIHRHETLRTAFIEIEGEPRQIIHSHSEFVLNQLDLSQTNRATESASEIANAEANFCFDLGKPPLLRATLVKLPDNRHLFIMVVH